MKKCKECGYEGDNFLKGFLICNTCVEKAVALERMNPEPLKGKIIEGTYGKKEARIIDTEELLKLKKYVDDELVERIIDANSSSIPCPAKLTDLRLHGRNPDMLQKDQVCRAIKSWINYFNELGKYFEEKGNQERANRHYVQAIAFEVFLGEKNE